MRRTEWLQEIRLMRFGEAYDGWRDQRLTQKEATQLLGVCNRIFRRVHTLRGIVSMDRLRIDSTVVASNSAPPRDSLLLNDGVRVLSRLLAKSKDITSTRIRFRDHRKGLNR